MRLNTYIIFAICIVLLSACRTSSTSTVKDEKITEGVTTKVDTFYQGGGNEPGWHVMLFKGNNDQINYQLLLNYGEDTLNGLAESLAGTNPEKALHFILHDQTKPLVLDIKYEHCTDDGDQQFETSVTLTDNKFNLHGCGSFE